MPTRDNKLDEYRSKRDFAKTPEPGPAVPPVETDEQRERSFVIQKHAASRLHYDFRLEVDGVLKSWAVPRGPSLNPADKRLAVMTEDHPMEYADFEGTIPEEEYGGGAVIVWDRGTYRNLKQEDPKHPPMTMTEGLAQGHATVWLEGGKLRGGFALVRTRGRQRREAENWLLIKTNDEFADRVINIVNERPESILSGRKIEELLGQ
jgi:DNA ligase D-like protein (predicted 3'-phosphoesterase)